MTSNVSKRFEDALLAGPSGKAPSVPSVNSEGNFILVRHPASGRRRSKRKHPAAEVKQEIQAQKSTKKSTESAAGAAPKIPRKSTATPVATSNSFQVLEELPEETPSTASPRKVRTCKPPPIVITSKVNYQDFKAAVNTTLKKDEYFLRYTASGVKLFAQTQEAYNSITTELDTHKYEYYSYGNRASRTKKLVFKGPPDMDTEEIKIALRAKDVKVSACVPMKGRNSASYSYLVSMDKSANLSSVKTIKNIDNDLIKWEPYHRRATHTQCHRCQAFGHGTANCHRRPVCLKCAGDHLANQCLRKRGVNEHIPLKCANCAGNHAANFPKCPALAEYLNRKNTTKEQPQKKNPQPAPTAWRRTNMETSYTDVLKGAKPAPSTSAPEPSPQSAPAAPAPAPAPAPEFPQIPEDHRQIFADYQDLLQEIREINHFMNIPRMLIMARQLKEELMSADSSLEQIKIMSQHV